MNKMGSGSESTYSSLRKGIKSKTSAALVSATSLVKRSPTPAASTAAATQNKPPDERFTGLEKNDPQRFVEGLSFKGKLIGVLEVSEARGDRMCQEALAELKMAVRAAGEHKQRITINVAMDGIRLRDERSTDCLYHHPVHKISFIAQDMTDTRAFGYIFGSPDAGHKFFGIKTEKTASQVVIAMRDLFQVVFELKKKEMEKARSQLEDRSGVEFRDGSFSGILGSESGIVSASLTSGAGGAIADLLDLQSELTSLQKGLSQLTQQQHQQPQPQSQSNQQQQQQSQNKDSDKSDPFGDSFKPPGAGGEGRTAKMSTSSCSTPAPLAAPPPLAPPPVSGRHRHDSHHSSGSLPHPHREPHKQPGTGTLPSKDNIQQAKHYAGAMQSSERDGIPKFPVSFPDVIKTPTTDSENFKANNININEDKYAVFKEFKETNDFNEFHIDGRFDDEDSVHAGGAQGFDSDNFDAEWSRADFSETDSYIHPSERSHYDVFTDLDPLGTGKVRPYVDKRDFFSEMRKPPPRVLRELGDAEGMSQPSSPRTQPGVIPREVATLVASTSLYCTTPRSSSVMSQSGQLPDTHSISTPIHSAAIPVPGNSFSDSFSPMSDSFGHETFLFRQQSGDQNFYDGIGFTSSEFADFNTFRNESPRSQRSELSSSIPDEPPPPLPCGPLTVALPPESFRDSPPHFSPPPIPHSPGQLPSDPSSPRLYGRHHPAASHGRGLSKQLTVATSSLSPRTLPRNHKFKKQSSFDNEWREIEYHQRKINMIGDKQMSEGGVSPRPRPRSTLTKQLSASSATLALRSSHNKFSENELSSPEMECKPFPNENLDSSSECAPLPPPRPAHVEPPPLPPKRQPTNIALRPPPPPPTTTSDSHYNYINEYDSSPEEPNATVSPPIPIPARKPRHTDNSHPSFIPSRPSKPVLGDSFEYPQTSISPTCENNVPVHKENSKNQTVSSKSPTPSKSPKVMPIASVDLANTSLDQLASNLNVPIEKLARMTVVELAACLAQLQMQQSGATDDGNKDNVQSHEPETSFSQPNKETSREDKIQTNSIARTEEDVFAKFDAQFPQSPVDHADFNSGNAQGGNESTSAAPLGAPVPEDRYAVFRELSTTVSKQKSIFDENFLTPQNSMEDEVSEVSSGTFKANCEPQQDLTERKSSLSEDGEVTELDKDKNWNPEMDVRIDHECVTVFRSPEISEYDNFEPVFDAKFDDEFSAATVSDMGETPVNSPLRLHSRHHSRHSSKTSADYHISPFTDDFSTLPQPTTTVYKTKPESQSYFAKFEDNFIPSFSGNKDNIVKDLSTNEKLSRIDSLRKSPFEDNFTNEECRERVSDSGFASGFGDSIEKFDDPFISSDTKTRSSSRSSNEFRKTPLHRENYSLQTPIDNFKEQRTSPFDDDFTNRGDRYEVLKEVESEREPSIEGEISRFNRQELSPSEESWHASLRNTPYEDQKSIDSLHSLHDEQRSIRSELGFDDEFTRRDSYSSRQRSQSATDYRKASFGDNFTQAPTEKNQGAYKLRHGSEASSVRQSPFEDNFCSVSDKTSEEVKFDSAFNNTLRGDSENVLQNDLQPSRENEDPFIVTNASNENEGGFADFDSAFSQVEIVHESIAPIAEAEALDDDPPINELSDSQTEEKFNNDGEMPQESLESEENVFPNDPEPEFKISARYLDQTTDVKKSPSVSIFRRDSDPFADDFFSAEFPEEQKSNQEQNEKSRHKDRDPFWEKPFDSFTFVKEH